MAEVVLALDLPTAREALALVDALPGLGWVKVGPTLFVNGGADLIRELQQRRHKVFLDLKWHDIPYQVAGAVAAAAGLGVTLATVHTSGGLEMMKAALEAAGEMALVGVTVLTSHNAATFKAATGRTDDLDISAEVARLAKLAADAGLRGVVASPLEVAMVRRILGPKGWIVVPGIRPAGTNAGDQQRTAEPRVAINAGATHLVVGRPITQAKDPRAAYQQLCDALN